MKKAIACLLCALLLAGLCLPGALAFTELKKGDRTAQVQMLQMRLDKLGYGVGKADAYYGGKTFAAVQAFQKDRSLPVTGTVDEATWEALYAERAQVSKDGYAASVALTAPFTHFGAEEGEGAVLWLGGDVSCTAGIVSGTSMPRLAAAAADFYENTAFAGDERDLGAAGFSSSVEPFDSNGRVAAVVEARYDYTREGKAMTAHCLWGAVEIAVGEGGSAAVCLSARADAEKGQPVLLTAQALRDVLSRCEAESAPAQARDEGAAEQGGTAVLGDWYAVMDNTALKMTFTQDGKYAVYRADGTQWAAGSWAYGEGGYVLDGGTPLAFDGGSFTVGSGDTVFGREEVQAPSLPFAQGAAAEDCLGTWSAVGMYMSDTAGLYDEATDMLREGDVMTAAYDGQFLTLTGMSAYEEVYEAAWDGSAVQLTPAPGSKATFEGGVMRLLDDGRAVVYVPGSNFITLVLAKAP